MATTTAMADVSVELLLVMSNPETAIATAVTAETSTTGGDNDNDSSALEIHVLVPFKTHSSPSRSAEQDMAATSEPALGSDKEKALIFSPWATALR